MKRLPPDTVERRIQWLLQDKNVKDLVRILQDRDHRVIWELAENPLLLTIIVLVHRIDAVLPDERVLETQIQIWR